MSTTHTEGPWKNEYDGSIVMRNQIVSAPIAPDGASKEECKANAQLIAAAPDLLDVAKYIVDRAEYQKWDEKDALLVCARFAIAKATGGQS